MDMQAGDGPSLSQGVRAGCGAGVAKTVELQLGMDCGLPTPPAAGPHGCQAQAQPGLVVIAVVAGGQCDRLVLGGWCSECRWDEAARDHSERRKKADPDGRQGGAM